MYTLKSSFKEYNQINNSNELYTHQRIENEIIPYIIRNFHSDTLLELYDHQRIKVSIFD